MKGKDTLVTYQDYIQIKGWADIGIQIAIMRQAFAKNISLKTQDLRVPNLCKIVFNVNKRNNSMFWTQFQIACYSHHFVKAKTFVNLVKIDTSYKNKLIIMIIFISAGLMTCMYTLIEHHILSFNSIKKNFFLTKFPENVSIFFIQQHVK